MLQGGKDVGARGGARCARKISRPRPEPVSSSGLALEETTQAASAFASLLDGKQPSRGEGRCQCPAGRAAAARLLRTDSRCGAHLAAARDPTRRCSAPPRRGRGPTGRLPGSGTPRSAAAGGPRARAPQGPPLPLGSAPSRHPQKKAGPEALPRRRCHLPPIGDALAAPRPAGDAGRAGRASLRPGSAWGLAPR